MTGNNKLQHASSKLTGVDSTQNDDDDIFVNSNWVDTLWR